MSLFEGIIEWSRQTFLPFGEFGLFIVAFAESSFFPIPPDIILIPLVLMNPAFALYYAAICTIGSALGSIFGYYIGKKGGRPVLKKLVSEKRVKNVEDYYNKYGTWAVGIAAFSPIPFKIFTIASGILKFSWLKVFLVSLVSRGARFFLEAFVLMVWGKEIIGFLIIYFEIATILIILIIVVVYIIYRKLSRKSAKTKH